MKNALILFLTVVVIAWCACASRYVVCAINADSGRAYNYGVNWRGGDPNCRICVQHERGIKPNWWGW